MRRANGEVLAPAMARLLREFGWEGQRIYRHPKGEVWREAALDVVAATPDLDDPHLPVGRQFFTRVIRNCIPFLSLLRASKLTITDGHDFVLQTKSCNLVLHLTDEAARALQRELFEVWERYQDRDDQSSPVHKKYGLEVAFLKL